MFCRNCGKELADGVKFCRYCGNPVSNPVLQNAGISAEAREGKKKSGKRKRRLAVGIVFLLIVLVTGGILFYLWGNDYINIPELRNLREQESREDAEESEEARQKEVLEETEKYVVSDGEKTTEAVTEMDSEEKKEEDVSSASLDLETEIGAIREQYNRIVEKRNNGDYERQQVRDGIEAYWDGDELAVVVVPSGNGGIAYSRSYYYANGDLFYAYYEEEDAYRLYFKDENLIRLRYAEDASRPSDAVNYDQENSEQYRSWEENTLEEGKSLKHEAKNKRGGTNNGRT